MPQHPDQPQDQGGKHATADEAMFREEDLLESVSDISDYRKAGLGHSIDLKLLDSELPPA